MKRITKTEHKRFHLAAALAAFGLALPGAGALAAHAVPYGEDSAAVAELGREPEPAVTLPDPGEDSSELTRLGPEPQETVVRLEDAEEPPEVTELGPAGRV